MSAASALSQDSRTSPAAESISSDEPTLTTMRRKSLSEGRDMSDSKYGVPLKQYAPLPDIGSGALARNATEVNGKSANHEGVELVAVGVAEIGGVELRAALSRGTFAAAAERQCELVNAIALLLVPGAEGRHHAVADGHR